MNILNIEHVSKVFGEKVVLDDVSYGVHQGDKIGIIGINGTGKSTILKIIGGLEEPDEGQVITQNGLRITYLPQMPQFPEGGFDSGLCGRGEMAEGLEYGERGQECAE